MKEQNRIQKKDRKEIHTIQSLLSRFYYSFFHYSCNNFFGVYNYSWRNLHIFPVAVCSNVYCSSLQQESVGLFINPWINPVQTFICSLDCKIWSFLCFRFLVSQIMITWKFKCSFSKLITAQILSFDLGRHYRSFLFLFLSASVLGLPFWTIKFISVTLKLITK